VTSAEPAGREQGTIVSMGHYGHGGFGHIRADNGDTLALFYWSVIEGFNTLGVGHRVEFSRARFGFGGKVATLVVPVTDPNAN
jgi:cold shock CspA family protein